MRNFYLIPIGLLAPVSASGACNSDNDCSGNWVQTSCCWHPNDDQYCSTWCTYTDESDANDYTGFITAFQEGASGDKSSDQTCMANQLDISDVNNYLNNAYTYGPDNAFQASDQFLQLGKKVSSAASTCETGWEEFWGDFETLAEDFSSILKIACDHIQLNPYEEECAANDLLQAALEVISLVNEGTDCAEMNYNLNQYESYWNSHNPSDQDFDSDVGSFAGLQYKYTKGCKALAENLAKDAWSSISSRRLAEIDNKDVMTSPKKERLLRESDPEPYFSNQNCKYCLPEAEFVDFYQGFYDGQTKMDKAMDPVSVKECIQNNQYFQQAYFGGLQASLTKIMVSYQNRNIQLSMDEIMRVQNEIENILDKEKCASLEKMAFLSNKALADQIQVNGTKAYFVNNDGLDVDVTTTALLVANFNQQLLQMQSEGTLSTQSKSMYQMGEQIGLTTKLIHIRSPQNNKSGLSQFTIGALIGSFMGLLGLLAFYIFNRMKQRKQTNDEPESERLAVNSE